MGRNGPTKEELAAENKILQERLWEAEQIIEAIRGGETDAFVIPETGEERIYTFKGADFGYRILVESMNEGALILSPDDSIYYCNQCFAEMVRFPIQKIIGTPLKSYIDQSIHAEICGLIHDSRLHGKARGEFLLKQEYGVFLPVNLSLNFVDLNEFKGVCAIITDLSLQKQSEKILSMSETKYKELVQLSKSIIMKLDIHNNFIFVNEYGKMFFGFSEDELIGHSIFEIILPVIGSPESNLGDSFIDFIYHPEEYGNYENEFFCKGLKKVWVSWTNQPIYDDNGNLAGVLLVGSDITERKKAAVELMSYAMRLEKLNKELEEFAFIASHDLREPLRKIKNFGDMIKRGVKDKLDETTLDYFARMMRSVDRMEKLIRDLLEYSRVASAQELLDTVDLNKAAMDAVADIEQSDALIGISGLPTVWAKSSQMEQLFQNIIANALKFNDKDRAEIKIYSERDNNEWQIFIEDNGIGFNEQYLDRIFAPFQRLHGRSEYEGTGMGLAICRKIVERHGGKLTAKSTIGKGSTFIITLPITCKGRE